MKGRLAVNIAKKIFGFRVENPVNAGGHEILLEGCALAAFSGGDGGRSARPAWVFFFPLKIEGAAETAASNNADTIFNQSAPPHSVFGLNPIF